MLSILFWLSHFNIFYLKEKNNFFVTKHLHKKHVCLSVSQIKFKALIECGETNWVSREMSKIASFFCLQEILWTINVQLKVKPNPFIKVLFFNDAFHHHTFFFFLSYFPSIRKHRNLWQSHVSEQSFFISKWTQTKEEEKQRKNLFFPIFQSIKTR